MVNCCRFASMRDSASKSLVSAVIRFVCLRISMSHSFLSPISIERRSASASMIVMGVLISCPAAAINCFCLSYPSDTGCTSFPETIQITIKMIRNPKKEIRQLIISAFRNVLSLRPQSKNMTRMSYLSVSVPYLFQKRKSPINPLSPLFSNACPA